MKYALTALAGLLLGAVAAAAVVYFNPLTTNAAGPAVAADWELGYSFPGTGVLTHTHAGGLPLARHPAGVPELWEETIRRTALTSLELVGRNGDAEAAWATRISVPSTATDLLFDGVVLGDHWLISVPGMGSFFLTAESNVWPALKDTYLRVSLLKQAWRGPRSYSPTLRSAGSPALRGATGRFAGIEGRGVETFEIAAYGEARGLESLEGRLLLEFDGAGPSMAPVAAE